MVNWTTKESYTRLLAAIYAAHPTVKFNFNEIARFYGKGATYDAIEGRFRIIKKEAEPLREEAGGSEPSGGRRKRSQQSVLTGRVTKRGTKGKGVRFEREEIKQKEEVEYQDDDEES